MLSFCTRHYFLKRRETWFYAGETIREAAYNVYPYATGSFCKRYDKKNVEQTVVIPLAPGESELFRQVHATFRYHIRRAMALGLTFQSVAKPSVAECEAAHQELQVFSVKRNFTCVSLKRLLAMHKAGGLLMMRMMQQDALLVTHLYLSDKHRAVLLASWHNEQVTDKRLRSKANKYLHWQSILFFKQNGHSEYDFGGISETAVPGITRFKLNFGGELRARESFIRVKPLWKPIFRLLGVV